MTLGLRGRTVHDFILRNGELFCTDLSTIRADDVSITCASGDLLGRYQDKDYEINLCEGCYDTVIRTLLDNRGSAENALVRCLRLFMERGNQQGDLQDLIKFLVPDWEQR